MKLKDRVAIVTGGAHGIGRAYSARLASEGASVLIADVDFDTARAVAKELQANGAQAQAEAVDVRSQEETERMAASALKHFGRIDALICNVGIYPSIAWDDLSLEDWQRTQDVNLTGTFLCCKAVVPQMKQQGGGSIITVASSTFWTGSPNLAHYIASKGGVIGLTRAMASELGACGITVNCVAPGLTQTETVRTVYSDDWFDKRVDQQSIKRKQLPEDLAGTVVYLCSDDAAFVTGQCIGVNGGLAFN